MRRQRDAALARADAFKAEADQLRRQLAAASRHVGDYDPVPLATAFTVKAVAKPAGRLQPGEYP